MQLEQEEEPLLQDVVSPIVVQLLLVGLIVVTALLRIAADNIVY